MEDPVPVATWTATKVAVCIPNFSFPLQLNYDEVADASCAFSKLIFSNGVSICLLDIKIIAT